MPKPVDYKSMKFAALMKIYDKLSPKELKDPQYQPLLQAIKRKQGKALKSMSIKDRLSVTLRRLGKSDIEIVDRPPRTGHGAFLDKQKARRARRSNANHRETSRKRLVGAQIRRERMKTGA